METAKKEDMNHVFLLGFVLNTIYIYIYVHEYNRSLTRFDFN